MLKFALLSSKSSKSKPLLLGEGELQCGGQDENRELITGPLSRTCNARVRCSSVPSQRGAASPETPSASLENVRATLQLLSSAKDAAQVLTDDEFWFWVALGATLKRSANAQQQHRLGTEPLSCSQTEYVAAVPGCKLPSLSRANLAAPAGPNQCRPRALQGGGAPPAETHGQRPDRHLGTAIRARLLQQDATYMPPTPGKAAAPDPAQRGLSRVRALAAKFEGQAVSNAALIKPLKQPAAREQCPGTPRHETTRGRSLAQTQLPYFNGSRGAVLLEKGGAAAHAAGSNRGTAALALATGAGLVGAPPSTGAGRADDTSDDSAGDDSSDAASSGGGLRDMNGCSSGSSSSGLSPASSPTPSVKGLPCTPPPSPGRAMRAAAAAAAGPPHSPEEPASPSLTAPPSPCMGPVAHGADKARLRAEVTDIPWSGPASLITPGPPMPCAGAPRLSSAAGIAPPTDTAAHSNSAEVSADLDHVLSHIAFGPSCLHDSPSAGGAASGVGACPEAEEPGLPVPYVRASLTRGDSGFLSSPAAAAGGDSCTDTPSNGGIKGLSRSAGLPPRRRPSPDSAAGSFPTAGAKPEEVGRETPFFDERLPPLPWKTPRQLQSQGQPGAPHARTVDSSARGRAERRRPSSAASSSSEGWARSASAGRSVTFGSSFGSSSSLAASASDAGEGRGGVEVTSARQQAQATLGSAAVDSPSPLGNRVGAELRPLGPDDETLASDEGLPPLERHWSIATCLLDLDDDWMSDAWGSEEEDNEFTRLLSCTSQLSMQSSLMGAAHA